MGKSFSALVDDLVGFINGSIVPLIFALAFLAMLFGILRYFFFEGEENREKGRALLLWGGAAMVLMFSIWGVVNLILASLGI